MPVNGADGQTMDSVRIDGLAEVVLNVQSLDRALAFYRDLLGLAVMPSDQANPVFLRAGAATDRLPAMVVLVQLPETAAGFAAPRPLHHLALTVPAGGYAPAATALEAAGIEVRRGRHPILGTSTLYIFDPDGNEVELIAPGEEP